MELASLEVVYLWQLRELVSIDRQLADLFSEIAEGAGGEAAVSRSAAWHAQQCAINAEEIAELITSSRATVGRRVSRGMVAIVGEIEELLQSTGDAQAVDAAVACAVRKAAHYELAALRAATTTATVLGRDRDLSLLMGIVQRAKAADRLFASMAIGAEPCDEQPHLVSAAPNGFANNQSNPHGLHHHN